MEGATYTPGKELASLDFESLVGGPLIACIHAQVQAAIATVNFVKVVGFEPPPIANANPLSQATGKPAYISFEYKKILPDGNEQQSRVNIPFLTMLPIPNLRINEVTMDFLAKINNVIARSVDTTLGYGGEKASRKSLFFHSAGMKVSSVYQKQTKEGNVVTREYSLNIRVKAQQEDLPPGMDRLLSILETGIQDLGAVHKDDKKA
eukprot:CAMPEP_0177658420 /NCGR_PEP_ID=MMETSP0447-20121125/16793_1 /TAXON_ID=0 /ORGANISM="Stygamoeba regulata, Strain BSH-02190019" /LENGTH=205 /DNA_ID=CAMNT_0019163009 /DNA_START=136 /DNA_END=753 /DNA_ORIENTATION=-